MNKLLPTFTLSTLLLFSALVSAQDNPHLYGCYFSQGREPGDWVTSTAALFIEKAPEGILIHGSVSSWHNSWISTPNNESPVLLKKAANKFVYHGEVDPKKTAARCELVLSYDKESIYINKYDQGCSEVWYTGDGVGPSDMKRAYKQPNSDMCLAYLGIVETDDKTGDKIKQQPQPEN